MSGGVLKLDRCVNGYCGLRRGYWDRKVRLK